MVAIVDSTSSSSMWHNKVGHMSEKGMKMLASKRSLQGLKSVDLGLCESFVLVKQKRVSFSKTEREPKTERLELEHTEVWRPSPVSSLVGSEYYVTLSTTSARRYEFIF